MSETFYKLLYGWSVKLLWCESMRGIDPDRVSSVMLYHLPYAVMLLDEHYHMQSLTPTLEHLLGYTHQELLGAPVNRVLPNLEQSQYWTEGGRTEVLMVHTRSGTWIPMEVTAKCIMVLGQRMLLCTFSKDVEKSELREKMKSLSERLILATKRSEVGIWDWDIQKNILIWDEAMYKLYGITEGTFSGAYDAWTRGVHPDDREEADRRIQDAIKGTREFRIEFRVKWPDGNVRHIRGVGHVERDVDGRAVRMIGTNWDITELKVALERIRNYASMLESKNKELEQFVYVSSHDLREPLRTVSNYIQLFREDYSDRLDADTSKYLSAVEGAIQRMEMLIRALLDYSRLGRNRELVSVDLEAVLRDICADLHARITERNVVLTHDPLPVVIGYEIELRQLFQNLIANAIKFCRKEVSPVIHIHTYEAPDTWHFMVKDNGIGIPEQFHTRIFQIFQRLHTLEEYEGNGIGLAYCRKITELHQGEISVFSKPDEGSTFYFTLSKHIST